MALSLLGVPTRKLIIALPAIFGVVLIVSFWFSHSSHGVLYGNGTSRFSRRNLLDDTTNSTLGFERIYILNLPSRTDRRDAMTLMASLSDLKFDWIDGVDGHTVPEKALPHPAPEKHFKPANIGSWRGHLNALRAIVENNLGSALILEDDADWDVRIKPQLRQFALASRALTQPLGVKSSADPTNPPDPTQDPRPPPDMDFSQLPRTAPPRNSPYGDHWDILWVGHCGAEFPNAQLEYKADLSKTIPRGRVVHKDDFTVPSHKHLKLMEKDDDLRQTYPPHTRVVHHVLDNICTLGYAVSQRGARRLLYEIGVRAFDGPFDLMVRDVCQGIKGHDRATCLTVQPQLFNHHRPAGNASFHSDISEHAPVINEHASTEMIRISTRLNLPALIGGTGRYVEQFQDE